MDLTVAEVLGGLGATLPTVLMVYVWMAERADHKLTKNSLADLTNKVLVKSGVIGG